MSGMIVLDYDRAWPGDNYGERAQWGKLGRVSAPLCAIALFWPARYIDDETAMASGLASCVPKKKVGNRWCAACARAPKNKGAVCRRSAPARLR